MGISILDELNRLKQNVASLDWSRRVGEGNRIETSQDRPVARIFRELDPAKPGFVLYGMIIDSLPAANWYRVQIDKLGIVPCCFLMASTAGPLGAKQISQLSPGDSVLVWHNMKWPYGMIFGAMPKNVVAGAVSDFVSLQSRCGPDVDGPYTTLLSNLSNSQVVDWSSFRPRDALIGDFGVMAETGVGWFADAMMAFMRANENCGLWAFWDGLLRLAGQHIDIRGSSKRIEIWEDYSELASLESEAIYLWEAMGAWSRGATVHSTPDASAGVLPLEPLVDDQDQFHRWRQFGGYLGHARHEVLCLPPDSPQETVSRLSSPLVLPGVYEEVLHLNGHKTIASAKGVVIAKRSSIPVPKRIKLPCDENGDTAENYLFAGTEGEGQAHTLVDDLATDASENAGMTRLAGTADRHSYLFEFAGRMPLRKHAKDWFMPDEYDARLLGGKIQTKIPFTQLQSGPYITPPTPYTATVDHKHDTDYWGNNSWFELLPDGGISIGDGFGSEIRMSGGNLYLTCPGDIFLQSGRDTVTLAGHDAITRAHNAADISTTKDTIRIRAAQKLMMKGTDEVALYSDGDIINKCNTGTFTVWSGDTYIRSAAGGSGDSSSAGMITLDASKGAGMIVTFSKTTENFLVTGRFDYFSDVNGTVTGANFSGPSGSIIVGNLSVSGCGSFGSHVYADGWLVAADGHVATSEAAANGNMVATLTGSDLTSVQTILTTAATAQTNTTSEGNDSYDDNLGACAYNASKPGNASTIAANVFTFRTDSEYMTTDFSLFENRWQQLARINSDDVSAWVELEETGTYPYPGAAAWLTDTSFKRVDLTLFDPTTLESSIYTGGATTVAAYSDPSYSLLDGVTPDGYYLIMDPDGAASPY